MPNHAILESGGREEGAGRLARHGLGHLQASGDARQAASAMRTAIA